MPAISWSNPNGEQPTQGQLQSKYEVSGGNISGVLGELMRQRQIEQQQSQQSAQAAIKGIADIVQKKKNDQIAQQFLDQASQYDSENPDATAMIARQLNESSAHPSDAWAAFEHYQQNKIKTDLEQAHANYFNRYQNMPGPGEQAPPRPVKVAADPWDKAIPVARGKLDDSGNFTNSYPEAAQGDQIKLQMPNGKTVAVPYDSWQGRQGGQPQSATIGSAPKIGERRTINGQEAEWDGRGWKAVE